MYGGPRKIAPDDVRGVVVPGDRLRGRAWRQGKFARARRWGSGEGRRQADAATPDPRLKLVEYARTPAPRPGPPPRNIRLGRILGWLAMGSVGLMWLVALLGMLSSLLFGGGAAWPALWGAGFAIGFIGSHLFGIASEGISGSRVALGLWAVGAFWISILGWVPLGMALAGFAGLR